MNTTPIKAGEPPSIAAGRSLALPFDPLLTLGAIGLAICSLVTLNAGTRGLVRGSPLYYIERQGVYFAIGLGLMIALTRFDYSRLRELKLGFYVVLIADRPRARPRPRGSGVDARIQLPFFSFQASELGKVILIVFLAAFVVDRSRRLHERETTARVMLLALGPAMLVIIQPDLGSGMVYVVVALAVLFIAGTSWKHFAALFTLGIVALTVVLVRRPGGRHPCAQALPGRPPHSLSEPDGQPGQTGLPTDPVEDRDRRPARRPGAARRRRRPT